MVNWLFFLVALEWSTVCGIIDSTTISLSEDETYYSYMWFGFEEGGTAHQSASVKAPENFTVGFYLCTSKQRDKIQSAFDENFCAETVNGSGKYRGCDFNYTITPSNSTNSTDPADSCDQPVCDPSSCPAEACDLNRCEEKLACNPLYCPIILKEAPPCNKETCGAVSFNSSDPCGKAFAPDIVKTVNIDVKINRTAYYWFVVTNCNHAKVEINMDYVVMNPGGEHLSVGYLEFKYLMSAVRIAWSCFIGLWVLSWIISRKRDVAIVQIILMVDASLWTIYSYVETEFWYRYSDEGVPNQDLSLISYIHFSIAEALFFSVMELATGGLGICRKRFKPSLKRNAPIIGALLLVLLWMYKLFGSVIYFIIGGLYLLFLKHFCSNISHNCHKLTKQIQLIAQVGIDPVSTPVWMRLRMFRILRVSLVLLLLVLSGSLISGVFYLELMPWISVCIHVGVLSNCYLIMFFYFRFKRRDPYFDKVVRLQLTEEGPLVSLEDITRGMVERTNLSPWSFGMPLPYPKDRVVSIVAPLVVVSQQSESSYLQVGVPLEVVIAEQFNDPSEPPDRAKAYQIDDSVVSAGDVELEVSSVGEVVDLRE